MKKMKLYILLLLVPLLLMGCIEKGVKTAITDTETTSGYTNAELISMISGSQFYMSGLNYNLTDLNDLKSQVSSSNPTASSNLTTLIDYLSNNVASPIYSGNSSFSYSTAVNKVSTYDNAVIGSLGIYTYSQLNIIKDELKALSLADLTGISLVNSLEVTIDTINKIKAINPFYANSYLLYMENKNFFEKQTYKTYLSSINFDITSALERSDNITKSLAILNAEISALESNSLLLTNKSSILDNMKQLRSTYQLYLQGKENFEYVKGIRALLHTSESSELLPTLFGGLYESKIENILTKLKTVTGSQKATDIIAEINAYKTRNDQYTLYYSTNSAAYFTIHSKVTNIVIQYQKLKNIEYTLEVELDLGDVI